MYTELSKTKLQSTLHAWTRIETFQECNETNKIRQLKYYKYIRSSSKYGSSYENTSIFISPSLPDKTPTSFKLHTFS